MTPNPVNSTKPRPRRRDVLRWGLAAACGGAVWPVAAQTPFEVAASRSAIPTSTQPGAELTRVGTIHRPWWLSQFEKSRVVQVRADNALNGSVPDPYVLADLVGQTVQALTDQTSPERAWREILGSAQRIVVTLDLSLAKVLNTTDAMARVLVQHLEAAGYHPRTVALVNGPHYLSKALGTRPPEHGWGGSISVGSRSEQLANFLLEADAVINVPFLIAHPIVGMSCGIRNLSTAVLRHPGRYYASSESVLLPEVIASKEVSSRARLTVVNAVRLAIRGGEDASEDDIAGWGGIVVGRDPVAVDSRALGVLLRARRDAGLDPSLSVPMLDQAAKMGLGRRQSNEVEHLILKHGL